MKTNSWSSIVSKDQGKPFARPASPPASNPSQTTAAPAAGAAAAAGSAKGGQKNGKGGPKKAAATAATNGSSSGNKGGKAVQALAPSAKPVDPDAKIVELSKKFDDSLKEIESKSLLLKTMQQEVQEISGIFI